MPALPERRLEGLCLRSHPLGEADRLLTLLTREEGLLRVVAAGARRPRSTLAAAAPLVLLEASVARGRSLDRLRQLQVRHSYTRLGQSLETLATAQWLLELTQLLLPEGAAPPGLLELLLHRLGQLEELLQGDPALVRPEALGLAAQGGVQLLSLGGYALPLDVDADRGEPLQPPLGDRTWHCSLDPAIGFRLGRRAGAAMVLTASELALLQRLIRPQLPRRADGALMGPEPVWLRLLSLLELWCREHLGRRPRALALLRQDCGAAGATEPG